MLQEDAIENEIEWLINFKAHGRWTSQPAIRLVGSAW